MFQSTLPVRGATLSPLDDYNRRRGFNPRSPCGERRKWYFYASISCSVSIHAPRAGSDISNAICIGFADRFNPRSPCGERRARVGALRRARRRFNPRSPCGERHHSNCCAVLPSPFQSTLPVRGATLSRLPLHPDRPCFNPRSPCGERPRSANFAYGAGLFQSTLPVRGATIAHRDNADIVRFQSTLPVRGATGHRMHSQRRPDVSIHAPRAGSDMSRIYPCTYTAVSIHAPRAGSDTFRTTGNKTHSSFNPRSPCGERPPRRFLTRVRANRFNPRSPCGERRRVRPRKPCGDAVSIHAPRAGSDSRNA